MLLSILNIVAPVFLVIGAGYLAVHRGLFSDSMVTGLMRFAVQFAVPCLLFRATSTMDLSAAYDWRAMLAFYSGSTFNFALISLLVWKFFGRRPGEAVAVAFGALFSNLLLLGLPISERAWGSENLATSYAIVSVHAPYCYLVGITTMEMLRADGRSLSATARIVVTNMFRNSLMIGLGLGFIVNLSQWQLPGALVSAIDILAGAALPAALFGLGGVLTRYSMTHRIGEVSSITVLSLFLHPGIALLLCTFFDLAEQITRSVVLMAAMAPGLNAYLFADMYQRGQGTAAGTVLSSTIISVFSISAWLWILEAL